MKITNKHNLPEPIVRAAEAVYPPNPDRISVTTLINPVQLEELRRRHWEELEEDVSDRLWAIMGTAMHNLFHQHANGARAEKKIEAEVQGIKIVGKTDLLDEDGTITDYKYTSVYAIKGEVKKEWEDQLNLYSWLYEKNGVSIKKLQIIAFLRDWQQSKTQTDLTYPETQIAILPVNKWDIKEAENYVQQRVELFKLARNAPDSMLQSCSPEERWAKDVYWQVVNGKKIANYSTKSAAQEWASETGGRLIQKGSGYQRCQKYCPASKFCVQFSLAQGIKKS